MADNQIIVEPAVTEDDFKGVALVENRAFGPSPLMELVFTGPPSVTNKMEPLPDGFPGHLVGRVEDLKKIPTKYPTVRLTKATDKSNGKIVGFGCWHFLTDPDNFVEPIDPTPGPNASSPELGRQFFNALIQARQERMNGKAHFLMFILAVDPDYQRRGIGQKLLDWGLKQADELKVPCWIDASKYGLGLYKKNGWEEVGRYVIDLAKWGGPDEEETTVHLIREPQQV